MLGIRWFKYRLFMNNEIRKYLGYAGGEIALIIAGILIALQIDAWNENRRVAEALNTQLYAVATSIAQDLDRLTRLKRQRIDTIIKFNRMFGATGSDADADVWFTAPFVEFASQLIAESQQASYFVAGTGAYRALESSGNGNYIRDERLRSNLLDYYATVDRIAFAEQEMNSLVRDMTLRYQTDTSRGFFEPYLREPLLAWQPREVADFPRETAEFRAAYRELISDSVTSALLRSGRNPTLLKEYEHLLTLGQVLLRQIQAHRDGQPVPSGEGEIFQPASQLGPPGVFVQGRFEAHSLGAFTAPFDGLLGAGIENIRLGDDHLTVDYPGGTPWQFFYVAAGSPDISVRRPHLDYSRFATIRLELKRESGCDNLFLVLKDAEDPDDGSQANVPLALNAQWTTHDIDLSRFSDADLARLNVVSGFLMDQEPCSFSIRDVSFLE